LGHSTTEQTMSYMNIRDTALSEPVEALKKRLEAI
jgi:hypothetical protein